jgi:four helix bundle protein
MEKQTEGPGHRRLLAWQEAKTLASLAYEMCLKQRHLIDRGLADQLRRAAISIPSNIAEGNGRGSLCELETQVEVCRDVKLLADDDSKRLLEQAAIVGRLIGGLIHYRKRKTDQGDEPEVTDRDLPP